MITATTTITTIIIIITITPAVVDAGHHIFQSKHLCALKRAPNEDFLRALSADQPKPQGNATGILEKARKTLGKPWEIVV